MPRVSGAVIVNSKLCVAFDATLPETATPLTPQPWPTASSEYTVLVLVCSKSSVSVATVVFHVVVPVFLIVTVTVAVPPSVIVDGTSEYDTNAALSPPLAAPAVNANAKNSPATAPRRSTVQTDPPILQVIMRPSPHIP